MVSEKFVQNTAIREHIVRTVESILRSENSDLVTVGPASAQMKEQIRGIIDDAIAMVDSESTSDEFSDRVRAKVDIATNSTLIGRSRAQQHIHPADSLAAAIILFDLALPELTRRLGPAISTPSEPLTVARALHHSIMARVVPASVGYVDALLEKLSIAQREERLRVSRELHDRVAHGIAAGIQRIALSRSGAEKNTDANRALLVMAEDILKVALEDTRQIALDLRQVVGEKILDDAVRDYLKDSAPIKPRCCVNSHGESQMLATAVGEEAFLLIREALRNALAHSNSSTLEVVFTWAPGSLRVEVKDDGDGFNLSEIRSGAVGLLTMRERAEAIGAELVIASEPGAGTSIVIDLPLEGVLA